MKDMPNIRVELTGFKDEDPSVVDMVNTIVKKHLNRIAEIEHKCDWLRITMKRVHEREKSEIYEVHAHLHSPGNTYSSVCVERNLMSAVDSVIEKAINEVQHRKH